VTPAARLNITLDLFMAFQTANRPADAVTSGFFRARRHVGDEDRGVILEQFYQLLRHHARLGWWLARQQHADSPRNRLLVWLVLGEGRTQEQLKRLFGGGKFAPAPLSDAENALLKGLRGRTIFHPEMPDTIALECPDWAAEPLRRRFGPAFEQELAATLTPPPLDLRVNPIKATRTEVLRSLKTLGLASETAPLAPQGIRVHERFSLARLPELKTGAVEIQDEGSQLVALLVDAKPGERVVDFCAGAGGKTLALASQMAGKGHLVACDISEARLKRCAERLRRAGLHNAQTQLLSSETDRWVKRRKGGYDRVLVDAPCSGTGTWRRNPDARWRAPDLGLDQLVALQARILASAARLVKPGGRLVYATCSMLPEENEGQLAGFLERHPAFRLVPLADVAPELASTVEGACLSLTPARHHTDGFFAAVLEREAEPAQSGDNA
jgi:16S rRNA (cytosine967-C5)-methyltransferase